MMFRESIAIGLAHPGSTPRGWTFWESVAVTEEMTSRAEFVSGVTSLPGRVAIVRGAPGAPDAPGLLARVPADLESLDPVGCELDEILQPALCAPLGMKAEQYRWRVDQMTKAEIPSEGRIRFDPDQNGWVAEVAVGRQVHTIPGGATSASEEAFERLIGKLPAHLGAFIAEMEKQADLTLAAAGMDPMPFPIRAMVYVEGASGAKEEQRMVDATVDVRSLCSRVLLGPEACFSLLPAFPDLQAPGCESNLVWSSSDRVVCEQPMRDERCDTTWTVHRSGDRISLARNCQEPFGMAAAMRSLSDRFVGLEAPSVVLEQHARRKASNQRERQKAIEEVLNAFRAYPALQSCVNEEIQRMRRGAEFRLRNGQRIRFYGPVRKDRNTGLPSAQVDVLDEGRPRRIWVTPEDLDV
ncbi:hypothetical protein [Thioalkalivibrio sp. ALE19]|uniref:hypothetical protein n=1 Tax=Thioalkalivibrio sp. ALE19 TaxID=1266909 RepID=UPI00048DEB0B|nr:hypothetical protein [Thioalkalivibrio sp. ALE19]